MKVRPRGFHLSHHKLHVSPATNLQIVQFQLTIQNQYDHNPVSCPQPSLSPLLLTTRSQVPWLFHLDFSSSYSTPSFFSMPSPPPSSRHWQNPATLPTEKTSCIQSEVILQAEPNNPMICWMKKKTFDNDNNKERKVKKKIKEKIKKR